MRLLKARRGDFTGADPAPSAFVAAPGTQRYQYDFVGNIQSTQILANANESTSSSDRTLVGSFNAVNEQTNYVETVGSGSTGSVPGTFAITHDAAGNVRTRETVAGGNRLAYRHDRWGRLTEVNFEIKNTAGYEAKPRARYRYNALGMRALVERDADTTDGTNSINERRYLYYNAAWQIVEEHVDAGFASASDPVSIDRIVQNIWGLRYIDDLVLRRVDANYPGSGPPSFADTASGDIDWEQYLTDHQFSVVAAVGRTGTLAFRVAYDAYGEARHLPAKDINGDGKVDKTDTTLAQGAVGKKLGQPGYNPDADWDRDGKITSADIAQFGSRAYVTALPQGQLAQPGSATQPPATDISPTANLARAANARSDFNIGYCGYRFNSDIGAYTVRFRHYDPTPGMCRWLERDPAGYQDGPSLYSYLGRNPMAGTDPYGLAADGGSSEFADGPSNQRRPPGDPIPPPRHGVGLGSVAHDSAAGRYIACEDARIAKLRHPRAGTFSNNWYGRSWYEDAWDTLRHMDPHEVLDALGVIPGIGVFADLTNAVWYAVEGRYGEALLSLGAAVPIVGDAATAAKLLRRADGFVTCKVLNIKCFVAGTLVLTPLGPVPIESLMPGDMVVSVDPETGALTEARVLGVSSGIAAEPCSEVTLDPGDKGGGDLETFTATDGHPFLVVSGESLDLRGDAEHVPLYEPIGTAHGRWVRAAELVPGDTVATRAGTATVVRVAPHDAPEVVYNLHVERTARYLVGACGAVVHNSPCSEAAEQAAREASKLHKSFASRAQMGEVGETMAGADARAAFRDAKRIAEEYGGDAADWVKNRSSSYTARDGAKFETHWVENIRTGERVEFKTKFPGGF